MIEAFELQQLIYILGLGTSFHSLLFRFQCKDCYLKFSFPILGFLFGGLSS